MTEVKGNTEDMKYIPDSFRKPFVDWLSFSVKYHKDSFDWIARAFGEKSIPMEKGAFGYTDAYFTDTQALIAFSPNKPQNKIHVSLSSGALFRISENLSVNEIVSKVIRLDGKFSRIDIAQDDYDGFLDMETIFQKLASGLAASRLRTFQEYRGNQQTQVIKSHKSFTSQKEESKRIGQTIYIGDMKQGKVFVRIYDKEAQTGKGYDHWVRVEFQLRHQAADNYCNPKAYYSPETGEETKRKKDSIEVSLYEETETEENLSSDFTHRRFSKTAFYYLKFLDPSFKIETFEDSHILTLKHKRHWIPSEWWTTFLNTNKGESIGMPKNETGLEEIKQWALNSTSGADYFLTRIYGENWIDEKEKAGKEKFEKNKKYQTLLKSHANKEYRDNESKSHTNV